MKILYIGMDNTNYGSRSHEVRAAEAIAEKGHEVVLCVERKPNFENDPIPDNLDIHVMPVNKGLRRDGKGLLGGIVEAVKREHSFKQLVSEVTAKGNIDAIFCSSISGADIATTLGRKFHIPTTIQVLDVPTWQLSSAIFTNPHYRVWKHWVKHLSQADKIVVNNNITKKDLNVFAKQTGVSIPAEIFTVPYGINTCPIDKTPDQEEVDQIIFVARLVPHKGVDLLIRAMHYVDDPPKLIIVGDGSERQMLEWLAKELKVNCEFKGALSDTDKITELKKSKFMVYPSTTEQIAGLSPIEAMYCGKPCICFDIQILRELYEDSVIYVPKADVPALGESINFLNTNPAYIKRKGEQGKEFVKRKLTAGTHAEKLLNIMSS